MLRLHPIAKTVLTFNDGGTSIGTERAKRFIGLLPGSLERKSCIREISRVLSCFFQIYRATSLETGGARLAQSESLPFIERALFLS